MLRQRPRRPRSTFPFPPRATQTRKDQARSTPTHASIRYEILVRLPARLGRPQLASSPASNLFTRRAVEPQSRNGAAKRPDDRKLAEPTDKSSAITSFIPRRPEDRIYASAWSADETSTKDSQPFSSHRRQAQQVDEARISSRGSADAGKPRLTQTDIDGEHRAAPSRTSSKRLSGTRTELREQIARRGHLLEKSRKYRAEWQHFIASRSLALLALKNLSQYTERATSNNNTDSLASRSAGHCPTAFPRVHFSRVRRAQRALRLGPKARNTLRVPRKTEEPRKRGVGGDRHLIVNACV